MRAKVFLCVLGTLAGSLFSQPSRSQTVGPPAANFERLVPAQKRIVIAASTLLDGKGHVVHNTRIVIEGSKIV
ncbi:MAG TPA: hypothetical protein VGW76_02425, partial [Pyrinomonadaceae bacterium]|nr:hypothetical protein [Pyrinomonadaceae bacterium]